LSVSNQTFSTQTGRKGSIVTKILLVASISLIAGLLIVSVVALYLMKNQLVSLQKKNSVNAANIIADDIRTSMLADNSKLVDEKIKEVTEHKQVLGGIRR
jgi:hypothetical protein